MSYIAVTRENAIPVGQETRLPANCSDHGAQNPVSILN